MVYAAARRQVRDATLAEDVMQNVFMTFARRVREIRSGAAVGAWLLQTTRFTAANAMKIQARRLRHERAVASGRHESVPCGDSAASLEEQWQMIEPHLDRAISRLSWADQTTVVLRFFRGLSLREVANATGTTEEAARKRISRAIDRLRAQLLGAGVEPAICVETSLITLLISHAVKPMPAHLLSQAAAAASATKMVGGKMLFGAFTMSGAIKIASGIAVAALIISGGIGAAKLAKNVTMAGAVSAKSAALAVELQPAQPPPTAQEPAQAFNAVYELSPGQNFKFVSVPFIPERWPYVRMKNALPDNFGWRDCIFFREESSGELIPQRFTDCGGHGNGGKGWTVHDLAGAINDANDMGHRPWQFQGDAALLNTRLPGDMVFRRNAAIEDVLSGLADGVSVKLGRKVVFIHDRIQHDVIVAAENDKKHPGDNGPRNVTVHILSPALNGTTGYSLSEGTIGSFLNLLGRISGQLVIDETHQAGQNSSPVLYHYDAKPIPDNGDSADLQLGELLASMTDQTGLTFTLETREVDVWRLAEAPSGSKATSR